MTYQEARTRVDVMADVGSAWGLSTSDVEALNAVLARLDALETAHASLRRELSYWFEEFGVQDAEVARLEAHNHGAEEMTRVIADTESPGVIGHEPAQRLREELRELRKDKERLDWLQSWAMEDYKYRTIQFWWDGESRGALSLASNGPLRDFRGGTIRAAIDAAREGR